MICKIDGVPYVSQRVDKSNYIEEGFSSLEEAQEWTDRLCGIACIKMVIARRVGLQNAPTLAELLKEGLAIGAYKSGVGWIHRGLVELAHRHDIQGGRSSIYSDLTQISAHIECNEIVVASVSPGFEVGLSYIDEKTNKRVVVGRGGHLVVITGYYKDESGLRSFKVHHPSSWADYEWADHDIEVECFSASFSTTGNILYFK